MNLVVRGWQGDEWPEKRVSIVDAEADSVLFINSRYSEIDESMIKAKEICHRYNCHDELVDLLNDLINNYELGLHVDMKIGDALSKARGEK